MLVKAWVRAMSLLTFPSNWAVFWVVSGWAVLYGPVGALLYGVVESPQAFDDSRWSPGILFGWPSLYWLIAHGLTAV